MSSLGDPSTRPFGLPPVAAPGDATWTPSPLTTNVSSDARALHEMATRRLEARDWASALEILQRLIRLAPSDPAPWLNLAIALRALGRNEEAMSAVDEALAIEPRSLSALLQSASLHEARGDTRTASAIYRAVMATIPARAELTPQLRRSLQAAKATIDSNNAELETFLEKRFETLRDLYSDESLGRFNRAVDTLLLKRRVYRPQPSFLYFPHLPAIEFYDRGDFPWLDSIEAATGDIVRELHAVMANGVDRLRPYVAVNGDGGDTWRELNNSRRWGAFFFWREGVRFAENLAACPRTAEALEAWPAFDIPDTGPTAMFSILDARTRIPPHTGVNNCRLVVHVPLVIPQGCGFRVGAETRPWEPGEAFVFDDTIEHEAWNDSNQWRAVLILDIWNPYLTAAEREMVRALTNGVADFYGQLPPYITPTQKVN